MVLAQRLCGAGVAVTAICLVAALGCDSFEKPMDLGYKAPAKAPPPPPPTKPAPTTGTGALALGGSKAGTSGTSGGISSGGLKTGTGSTGTGSITPATGGTRVSGTAGGTKGVTSIDPTVGTIAEPKVDVVEPKPAEPKAAEPKAEPKDVEPAEPKVVEPAVPAAPAAPMVFKTPPQTVKLPKSMFEKTFYKDAKVGDFTEMESVIKAGEMVITSATRQEVIKAGDHTLTIKMTNKSAAFSSESELTYEFTEPDAPEMKVEAPKPDDTIKTEKSTEDVVVDGKTLKTDKQSVSKDGKLISVVWTSTEVPLGGMVKSETGDTAKMTLVKFGRGK